MGKNLSKCSNLSAPLTWIFWLLYIESLLLNLTASRHMKIREHKAVLVMVCCIFQLQIKKDSPSRVNISPVRGVVVENACIMNFKVEFYIWKWKKGGKIWGQTWCNLFRKCDFSIDYWLYSKIWTLYISFQFNEIKTQADQFTVSETA